VRSAFGGASFDRQTNESEEMVIMFKKIVVGSDGSATSLQAVAAAVGLASQHGAELHIVSSFPILRHPQGGYVDPVHEASPSLSESEDIAHKGGVEPTLHPTSGKPADDIVSVANDIDADLVVVGNKGMRGKGRVLGSVPNTVAHSAPCSVLIFDSLGAD
jgi:nucleotide-binding universal stress UspA family protein